MLFAVVWLATIGQRALVHPDEGRYAELSLAMLQSGDWITPRLNGFLYFEKPVFQYWMGALSLLAFGVNEFAVRLWPALAGLLSILAVGLTARRLWGDGQFAALVMGGSLWVIGNSHFLTLDAGLTFFLTLALCAFLWAQHDGASTRERRYGMWLAWAAIAGATLSKGLIGIVIPGASLVLYGLIDRQWSLWRRLQWLPGIAILALLAAPWFWLVSARNPGFAEFFFIREHFARYLTAEAQRPGPLWYFVPLLLAGFLPWTTWLPRLVREGWPRRPAATFQSERFLLVWAAFVFVFFSLSHSKLPAYILPMFPALALLLGQTLARAKAAEVRKHLWLPVVLWAVAGAAFLAADRFVSPSLPRPELQRFLTFLAVGGGGFVACAAQAWRLLARERIRPALMLLAAGNLWAVSAAMIGHDAFAQATSSKALVEQIRPYLRPEMEIFAVHNAYNQSLPFYLRRPVTQVDYVDEFAFGQQAEPGKAIATLADFVSRWQTLPAGIALLDQRVYADLQRQGVAMELIYQYGRQRVVSKP